MVTCWYSAQLARVSRRAAPTQWDRPTPYNTVYHTSIFSLPQALLLALFNLSKQLVTNETSLPSRRVSLPHRYYLTPGTTDVPGPPFKFWTIYDVQ